MNSARNISTTLGLGNSKFGLICLSSFIIFLLLLPLFSSDYLLYVVMRIAILCLLSYSLNLLLGYTGLLSFGQAGFYACGAYACGKILLGGASLLPGIFIAMVVGGIVAIILGYFCVRHTAIYFAMLTLAFGMMIFSLAEKWIKFTGGDDGLVGIPRANLSFFHIFSVEMNKVPAYYYFVIIISLVAIYLLYRIIHSPLGLIFQGIRDSEKRIAFIGISVKKSRLACFTIAGIYASLAGALFAPLEQTVTPTVAHWVTSMDPIIATLLGGMYSFTGPVVGSVIYFLVKDIIVRITMSWMLILGIIIVILVLAFRGGIMGFLHLWLFHRWK
ncbi:MAG: branched-chain amino acid ABC transporter permease [Deltaproteobacteria bacterium]|nr:branched-chain amino acid ABC transporter permease [Deltaproteobacteria bacterium]MBW1930333.1 branched-chain amino acid ABC transporter permease [Deltaproteobacteria bacterium]MBW2025890.1 branched-chain amino acid ABC transporter permease [Deltaproteobacteria bacterium]MBW2125261.1 branched-chain amino acid ABC transporter permease [Deltaproteobacteria bacterium]